jgi:hypothetical protein
MLSPNPVAVALRLSCLERGARHRPCATESSASRKGVECIVSIIEIRRPCVCNIVAADCAFATAVALIARKNCGRAARPSLRPINALCWRVG